MLDWTVLRVSFHHSSNILNELCFIGIVWGGKYISRNRVRNWKVYFSNWFMNDQCNLYQSLSEEVNLYLYFLLIYSQKLPVNMSQGHRPGIVGGWKTKLAGFRSFTDWSHDQIIQLPWVVDKSQLLTPGLVWLHVQMIAFFKEREATQLLDKCHLHPQQQYTASHWTPIMK